MDTTYNKVASPEQKSGLDPNKLDFCPVAIMYCKLIEAILVEFHTSIYVDVQKKCYPNDEKKEFFNELKTGMGRFSRFAYGRRKFPEAIQEKKEDEIEKQWNSTNPLPECNLIKDLPLEYMGQIYWQLPENVRTSNENFKRLLFCHSPEDVQKKVEYLAVAVRGYNNQTKDYLDEWQLHLKYLALIVELRNRSSHLAKPISKYCVDWLVEALFKNGELFRMIELVDAESKLAK